MTEDEYINVSNNASIKIALSALKNVATCGDGINQKDFNKVTEYLSTTHNKLIEIIGEVE